MLRPASTLPVARRGRYRSSIYEPDVREFVRSKVYVSIVEIEGKDPHTLTSGIQHFLKKHPDAYPGVWASERTDPKTGVTRCYIYRDETRK